MSKAQSVSVIGLGNWGTALANHLAKNGCEVRGWSNSPAEIDGINEWHKNPTYLKDVELHERFSACRSMEDLFKCDLLLLVVPSAALGSVVPRLSSLSSDIPIISAIKGFEEKTLKTPLQFAKEYLPNPLCVISGPSFAVEIAHGKPAGVVAASSDDATARFVAETFSSPLLKVYTSNDPLGVELGGAVKNVIALAAGMCDGLDLGESARAGLITRGLAEIVRLASAMGAQPQTFSGLSGIGDLAMTATSPLSRNHTVGFLLGQGKSLNEILETLGSVCEGVHSTPLVMKLAKSFNIDMPITEQMDKFLKGEVSVHQVVENLLLRPMKREF